MSPDNLLGLMRAQKFQGSFKCFENYNARVSIGKCNDRRGWFNDVLTSDVRLVSPGQLIMVVEAVATTFTSGVSQLHNFDFKWIGFRLEEPTLAPPTAVCVDEAFTSQISTVDVPIGRFSSGSVYTPLDTDDSYVMTGNMGLTATVSSSQSGATGPKCVFNLLLPAGRWAVTFVGNFSSNGSTDAQFTTDAVYASGTVPGILYKGAPRIEVLGGDVFEYAISFGAHIATGTTHIDIVTECAVASDDFVDLSAVCIRILAIPDDAPKPLSTEEKLLKMERNFMALDRRFRALKIDTDCKIERESKEEKFISVVEPPKDSRVERPVSAGVGSSTDSPATRSGFSLFSGTTRVPTPKKG